MPPTDPNTARHEALWRKLVVSLELADLTDPGTRERLDSAAAKANSQGVQTAATWRYAHSLPMLTAAIEIWARLGHAPGEVGARNTRGGVYRRLGQVTAAQDDHGTALALAMECNLHSGAILARCGLGAAYVAQGDFAQAEPLIQTALALGDESGDQWGTGHAHRVMARLHEARKEWEAARDSYLAARAAWEALSAPVEQIEEIAGLAGVALSVGYTLDASALADEVLRHLGQHGPARLDEPLRVYWTLYRVFHMMQQESADDLLALAHRMLHQQAEGLSEEERALFFDGVPVNRAILAAWGEE